MEKLWNRLPSEFRQLVSFFFSTLVCKTEMATDKPEIQQDRWELVDAENIVISVHIFLEAEKQVFSDLLLTVYRGGQWVFVVVEIIHFSSEARFWFPIGFHVVRWKEIQKQLVIQSTARRYYATSHEIKW